MMTSTNPVPCPAKLVPDTSDGTQSFNAAYHRAQRSSTVYVGIEVRDDGWAVKLDPLPAGAKHHMPEHVVAAIASAAERLLRRGEIAERCPVGGPEYLALTGIETETRARDLAAALHAAHYGDLGPLTHAVPLCDLTADEVRRTLRACRVSPDA